MPWRSWIPSTWCAWPAMPWTGAVAASSRTPAATGAARATRSTARGGPLHTGAGLLTDKQTQRLENLFATGAHVEVEATWGIYQRMITAYRDLTGRRVANSWPR